MKSGSEFSEFSRILKSLQVQNVSISQLRLLKQQHAYLEKLRLQRTKIQELKLKFDQSEQKFQICAQQNKNLKIYIEQQNQTINELEQQIQEQIHKRNYIEQNAYRQIQSDRQKEKLKMIELSKEIQQLKKNLKHKDILILQIEEQYTQKVGQMKDLMNQEKRKIINQYEKRIKELNDDKDSDEKQQLKSLLSRHNKALKAQGQQYQNLLQRNKEITEENQYLKAELQKCSSENEIINQQLIDINEQVQILREKLGQYQQDNQAKEQLQQIRKKMGELAKGQIQRIQFIVNQFQ